MFSFMTFDRSGARKYFENLLNVSFYTASSSASPSEDLVIAFQEMQINVQESECRFLVKTLIDFKR